MNSMTLRTQDRLEELLFAAFNISPDCLECDRLGKIVNSTACKVLEYLCKSTYITKGKHESVHAVRGALIAAKLFVEVMEAEDPMAYAKAQIERADKGKRFGFNGISDPETPSTGKRLNLELVGNDTSYRSIEETMLKDSLNVVRHQRLKFLLDNSEPVALSSDADVDVVLVDPDGMAESWIDFEQTVSALYDD